MRCFRATISDRKFTGDGTITYTSRIPMKIASMPFSRLASGDGLMMAPTLGSITPT